MRWDISSEQIIHSMQRPDHAAEATGRQLPLMNRAAQAPSWDMQVYAVSMICNRTVMHTFTQKVLMKLLRIPNQEAEIHVQSTLQLVIVNRYLQFPQQHSTSPTRLHLSLLPPLPILMVIQ